MVASQPPIPFDQSCLVALKRLSSQGFVHVNPELSSDADRDTQSTRLLHMALDCVKRHHTPAFLVLDAFFASSTVFELAGSYWSTQFKLAYDRRRIVHFNITEHPTAQWTAQQIVDAFPWDTAPRYLLRDRDSIYGEHFQERIKNRSIKEVKIAPHSPWQNPYCERVIGSIRRECLDDVIVWNERHLRRILQSYVDYYHIWRQHRSLEMDAPKPRPVQPPAVGPIRKVPEVGGFHHHYERIAA